MSPAPPPAAGRRPLTVVVVEDNKTQRAVLRRVLEAEGDIAVVGEASSASEAVEVVKATRPKVVTVDLQIQGGGIDAIRGIVSSRPTPVLVLSVAVDGAWSTRAVDALAAGAAEVLPKPMRWDEAAKAALRDRVRSIARLRLRAEGLVGTPAPLPSNVPPDRVIAIAASTGGPPALAHVLSRLERVAAPVLVVQHLHADFMDGFVAWLGKSAAIPVKSAVHGERLKRGVVYVAPGDRHLRVGSACSVVLDRNPATIHRPSADELFASVAAHIGTGAVAVLLTGMGADGAAGLRAVRDAGGVTIVQDEETSAVFGMPQAAIKAGAAQRVVPLDGVADAVLAALGKRSRSAR